MTNIIQNNQRSWFYCYKIYNSEDKINIYYLLRRKFYTDEMKIIKKIYMEFAHTKQGQKYDLLIRNYPEQIKLILKKHESEIKEHASRGWIRYMRSRHMRSRCI